MRYIQKKDIPQFFIDDTEELRELIKVVPQKEKKDIWDKKYKRKRELKKYLLEIEQNWLCGYCEAKLEEVFYREKREDKELIHIEHIKPKYLDYDNLSFDYYNLLVSCSGKCFTKNNRPLTCGHKKGNKFNENLFLNPIKERDIRDYFIYTNSGQIGMSSKDQKKSKYTMDLLELNTFDNELPEARLIALKEFRNSIEKYSNKIKITPKKAIKLLLSKENLAFISFLRYKYKHLI